MSHKKSHPTEETCLITLKILGDYWTLRIIDTLEGGEIRFCELQRSLNNLNPVTLSNRLKKLEQSHIIERQEETIDGASVTYSLTPLGAEVLPVIKELNRFASKAKSFVQQNNAARRK